MPKLLLLPTLRASLNAQGEIGVTQKFLDGVLRWQKEWGDGVSVLMEPRDGASGNLDDLWVRPEMLPPSIEISVGNYASVNEMFGSFRKHDIILGSLGYRQNSLPGLARLARRPFVTTSEYTLRTRWQIAAAEVAARQARLRRQAWDTKQEALNLAHVRLASGIQCNGVPTYHTYRAISASALLFFDTRTTDDQIPGDEHLERKASDIGQRPWRLAYSGRLERMKGVDHLPEVASHLRSSGLSFTLEIFGDGPLRSTLESEIQARQLGGNVKLRGTLPFASELIPTVRDSIDLMVLPHVQGDPSCTYLETAALGVPIVAYRNEAWEGLLAHAALGWAPPSKQHRARELADAVLHALKASNKYTPTAKSARDFGRLHTFERSFRARVEHLRNLCR